MAQLAIIKQMIGQVSHGSDSDYQAEEREGVTSLTWRLSSRGAGRVRPAQLAIIKQMIGQVSRGSAGDYQADDRASVTRLRWRLSIR